MKRIEPRTKGQRDCRNCLESDFGLCRHHTRQEIEALREGYCEAIKALKAVVAVADRKTKEFDLARSVLARALGQSAPVRE